MPTTTQALWLLPFLIPLCFWVTFTDLKYMKIRNEAVIATAAVWLILGYFAVGMHYWLWGFAIMAIVLVLTFIGNILGLFGAGDANFAAAISSIYAGGDWRLILVLYMTCSIGALLVHRILRGIPAVRNASADWKSWHSRKFPFGLALSSMAIFYLLAAFLPQG